MIRRLPLLLLLLAPSLATADEPKVYFTPEGDFQKALVKELLSAKKTVDIALYSFQVTSKQGDPDYAALKKSGDITPLDALRERLAAGVRVRVVLNHAVSDRANSSAAAKLLSAGAKVWTTGSTMHSKFAIIDGDRIINGSGNWSIGAFNRYHENWVIFPPDKKLAADFKRNMNQLLAEKKVVKLDADGLPKVHKGKAGKVKLGKAKAGTYFTTDNDGDKTTLVEDVIVKHMRAAKKEVQIAVAHFNSERLADELLRVKKRGVKVRVLVDLGEYSNRNSQATRLQKAKVDLRYHVYSVKMFFPFAQLMHHKMMIVDGKTLITGSYNWSRTAEHGNHENIQVLKQKALIKAFQVEFERLWALRRDVYPKFMTRLKAKKGTSEYRRFWPCHFPPMALTGKEMAALRRIYVKAGFAFRPYKSARSTNESWNLDQEKRVGTNDPPEPPYKPFFDQVSLVLSEVCFEPEHQKTGEFLELYNGLDEPVDLAGWRLSDGDAQDTIVAYGKRKTTLKPGGVALVIDPDFNKDFKLPRGVVVVTVGDKSLGNGLTRNDDVSLIDPSGKTVDSCKLAPATKKGQSLTRKSLLLPSSPNNWEPTAATPGKVK